jgi:hypothetical protein
MHHEVAKFMCDGKSLPSAACLNIYTDDPAFVIVA